MRKRKAFFLLALLWPGVSFAFRCGTDLVSEGDWKYEVLQKCGQPVSQENIGYIDKRTRGNRITVLQVEEWIYKRSRTYYRLVFEGNELVEIETSGF